MHPLEMVQRSAARIVRQIRRGDRQSMTTILRQLHWLPVRKRIDFKLLVHRAKYNDTPEYLAALLRRHTPPRSLRSAGGLLLEVPRVNLERFGRLCRTHSVEQISNIIYLIYFYYYQCSIAGSNVLSVKPMFIFFIKNYIIYI